MRLTSKFATLAALVLVAASPVAAQRTRPDGWTDATHSNNVAPNYDVVFPQDTVNTITITIAPDEWTAMLDDMTQLAGEFGTGGGLGPGRMPGNFMPPDGQSFTPPDGMGENGFPGGRPGGQRGDFVPPQMPPDGFQFPPSGDMGQNGFPGGRGGMGGDIFNGRNPMWVAVDIEFNGITWPNVGMRFKGNSSLSGTWRSGIYKLPFKLDFDEFEDDYPEINNQRFYGFKQISFSSNWSDDSLLREKVTADVFRDAGLVASQTAFYAVYVDYGEGPVYFGLYTAVEVVEDTVIETQFSDGSGNVYKPEGRAATFAFGTFNPDELDKETNKSAADYSDVQALYDALHDPTRQSDPDAWRAKLEAVFDVDTFLRWLAANTIVQNWDTYGQMSHNYYLYNNPDTGLLTWIPWDNNMALSEGFNMGGRRGRGGGQPDTMPGGMMGGPMGGQPQASLSFDKAGVSAQWPLIRYLLDQPEYYAAYVDNLAEISEGAFAPTPMAETYTRLHTLIAPYVVGENGEQPRYTNLSSPEAFAQSLDSLIAHAQSRYEATQAFLAER